MNTVQFPSALPHRLRASEYENPVKTLVKGMLVGMLLGVACGAADGFAVGSAIVPVFGAYYGAFIGGALGFVLGGLIAALAMTARQPRGRLVRVQIATGFLSLAALAWYLRFAIGDLSSRAFTLGDVALVAAGAAGIVMVALQALWASTELVANLYPEEAKPFAGPVRVARTVVLTVFGLALLAAVAVSIIWVVSSGTADLWTS